MKDTAVTAFVIGMVTGMIVAFASCSAPSPDSGYQQPAHDTRPTSVVR